MAFEQSDASDGSIMKALNPLGGFLRETFGIQGGSDPIAAIGAMMNPAAAQGLVNRVFDGPNPVSFDA